MIYNKKKIENNKEEAKLIFFFYECGDFVIFLLLKGCPVDLSVPAL